MRSFLTLTIFIAAMLFAVASNARAGSIGPNCGTCQGSIYTLTNLGLVSDSYTADGVSDTWRVALTIDTTLYSGAGKRIDEVAIKVSSAVNKATLFSAPGGASDWTLNAGGINANGCSGSGSGFDCADLMVVNSSSAPTIPGAILTWVFDIDVVGPLLTGTNQASIKARYVTATDTYTPNDPKTGALVSENITLGPVVTPIPEPATAALLVSGMAAAAWRRRRARNEL